LDLQIGSRQQQIEENIHKLDKEINGYKQQMAKMRPGPAKVGRFLFAQCV
jgi:hypothetical protein